MSKGTAVLVDSNIYIGLLHRKVDPTVELGGWVADGKLVTCGMVRLEVERGFRNLEMKKRFTAFFDVMIMVPTINPVWEFAIELAWRLDRKGRTLPAQDLLIAACAMQTDGVVLTDDAHFLAIPNLKVLHPAKTLPGWSRPLP